MTAESAAGDGSLLARIAAIVVAFLAAGALGGFWWERLWNPTEGLAYQGTWYLEPSGPDLAFEAVALFVAISFCLGLLLGVAAGIWRGHEGATVVSVLVAAFLATGVMYAVGSGLGPDNPQVLAAGAPDYTSIPGSLGLNAPDPERVPWRSTALLGLPLGAMTALVGVYLFGGSGLRRRTRG